MQRLFFFFWKCSVCLLVITCCFISCTGREKKTWQYQSFWRCCVISWHQFWDYCTRRVKTTQKAILSIKISETTLPPFGLFVLGNISLSQIWSDFVELFMVRTDFYLETSKVSSSINGNQYSLLSEQCPHLFWDDNSLLIMCKLPSFDVNSINIIFRLLIRPSKLHRPGNNWQKHMIHLSELSLKVARATQFAFNRRPTLQGFLTILSCCVWVLTWIGGFGFSI